jgi:hypothetical protein
MTSPPAIIAIPILWMIIIFIYLAYRSGCKERLIKKGKNEN